MMIEQSILQDTEFRATLAILFQQACSKRRNRPEPPKGMRYKRDWYDNYGHSMTSEFILSETQAVWDKTSKLPSQQRAFIAYISGLAVQRFLINKQKETT
jgi:hypothetical protein